MNGFAQQPCRNCGTTVWIATNTGTGFCPQCHTPNTLAAGPQAPSQAAAQQSLGVAATMAMEAPPGGWGSVAQAQPQSPPPAQFPYQGAPSNQGFGSQPGAPAWGQPNAAPQQASQPSFGGAPQSGAAPFGAPQQPQWGAPPQGQPPFGGAPQQGAAPFGAPQSGAAPFGAPQQPQWGAPQQNPYGQGQPPFGAAQQNPYPQGAPAMFPPSRPSGGVGLALGARIAAGVVLALVVGFAKFAARGGGSGFQSCGRNSLGHYDITAGAADPAKMYDAAQQIARRWQSDAVLHSIIVHGLKADGTIDLSANSNAVTYEFFSPRRVSSYLERERRDSIKKITFTSSGITHATIWGVRERVQNPVSLPNPVCTLSQLGRTLAAQGVTGPNGLQVNYSITDSNFVNGALAWHVLSSSPAYNRWYDAGTCTPIRIVQ